MLLLRIIVPILSNATSLLQEVERERAWSLVLFVITGRLRPQEITDVDGFVVYHEPSEW